MNYIDLIKWWHTKASIEDYFSKYVFEYLAFIAILRTQKYEYSDNDRDAFQKLKQDSDVRKRYLSDMDQETKESRNKLIEEFNNNWRLWNVSSLTRMEEIKRWNHICDANSFCRKSWCDDSILAEWEEFTDNHKGKIYWLENWWNMVEFWRTIRDNLFHWAKDPERERDKLVVEYWYKTLRPLVKILLQNL